MTRIADTLKSLEGRLDDVRREQAWRSITRTLDTGRVDARRWRPRWFLAAAAAAAALALAVLGVAVGRDGRSARWPFTLDAIAAAPAEQRTLERGGVTITVLGPGSATIADGRDGTLHVRVGGGTLVAERASGAVPVTVFAGHATTVSRDPRFAVRVDASQTVFGAGEHARAIVERHPVAAAPSCGEIESRTAPATKSLPAPARVNPPRRAAPGPAGAAEPPAPRASDLYQRAEAALSADDPAGAREHLERLLREFPDDPLVDAARYDLALLAHRAGDDARALALLDAILAGGRDGGVRTAAEALVRRLRGAR